MVQTALRAALLDRSDVHQVGPFVVAFDPDDGSPFRNYAIPNEGAVPSAEPVARLREAFAQRDRLARVEFLPAAAPEVEGALLAGGFEVDERLAVMTFDESAPRHTPPVPGVEFALVDSTAEEILREVAAVQNEAYGAPPPNEADVARLRDTIDAGGAVGLARSAEGEAVGAGLVTVPNGGMAELAPVAVKAAWRKRGIAAALTALLTDQSIAEHGAVVMLMAYDAEQGIYARAGFAPAGEMVFMTVPS